MDFFDMTEEDMDKYFDEVFKRNKDKILEMFIKEIEELKNKETKQHKSLSNYRCYEELYQDCEYKFINFGGEIEEDNWWGSEDEKRELSLGNIYSIDTPNELLEREIKKRQLWFNLEKHLKENNCLATSEDWKDTSKFKYCVSYGIDEKNYDIDSWYSYKFNTIYSTDKVALYDYMKNLTNEDIKIMFDVEV